MEKKKILLVDDEPDIVETIRFSLEQEGYEIVTAADGMEALDRARQIVPDLMVLDVMMPKENGYRVARTIREDEKAGRISKRIPIVLLTARNLEGDPEREKMFMEFSQADAMMYKPFEMDDLVQKIKQCLSHS
jgi:two-component system, OmpR family, alkaline phosphatase synthesis response regulator PhoP